MTEGQTSLLDWRDDLGPWQDWARQQLVFTEALRGGPLVWPAGASKLSGDPLGPVRHAHDDAAEFYFILDGRCLVEVAGEEFVAAAGDLVYIPADAPHNLLGEVGGCDAWVLVLVAPNYAQNKWRTADFLPGSENLRMTVSRPFEGEPIHPSEKLAARPVRLTRSSSSSETFEEGELVLLLVKGAAHVRIGNLAGNLRAGDFVHVRCGVEAQIASLSAEVDLLRFECPFVPFAGVDLGSDRNADLASASASRAAESRKGR